MQYMLFIYWTPEHHGHRLPPEESQALFGAYMAYTEALRAAGVYVAGEPLHGPEAATTVRVKDGKRQVIDGPLPEAKEELAGFYTIDVPDLDAAVDWAARCPGAAYGGVEVRPVMVFGATV